MNQFTSIADVPDPMALIQKSISIKGQQFLDHGKGMTLGLIFFNPSLRTRMSTQKASFNLGMNVMVINASESWGFEFEDGTVMDGSSQEHIKEAVKVMSSYCDILGVRTFPTLSDRNADYSEKVLSAFVTYSSVPVISLESAKRHPLQSLADMVTITELGIKKPKVVLTWAPHPKVLPQAVPNSFLEWAKVCDFELVLTHPKGYELCDEFTHDVEVIYDQEEAFDGADVVYAKNWSSFEPYGEKLQVNKNWIVNEQKMELTNKGKFMHCLPIRRNVVATDAVIDNSLVYRQAENRLWSAQAVLMEVLNGD